MISVWGTPIVTTVEQVVRDLKLERFDEGLLREINNTGAHLLSIHEHSLYFGVRVFSGGYCLCDGRGSIGYQ